MSDQYVSFSYRCLSGKWQVYHVGTGKVMRSGIEAGEDARQLAKDLSQPVLLEELGFKVNGGKRVQN